MSFPAKLTRLTGALALALSLLAVLAASPSTLAQTGDSSIEVHNRICPTDYAGTNFFADCHDSVPDPGLPFTFTSDEVTQEGTTNENGNVGFANLPAGTYTITGGAPGEFTEYAVYCAVGTEADSNQSQISVEYVTGGVAIDLAASTNVICDWYTIPLSQNGEEPEPTEPTVGDSSIEVHNRICPEGYSGGNWFEDCHGNVPDPGLPFTFANGVTQEGTTNESGNVGFANLPAGTYTITGGAPGEFTDYAVYCSVGTEAESNQSEVPVEYVTGGIQIELAASTNVICDWYIVPMSQEPEPTATEEPQSFDLPVYKLLCEDEPGQTALQDFVTVGTVPDGCEQYAGATITVTDADGAVIGSCVTEADAPCYVSVTVGSTVFGTEDMTTVPSGYEAMEGETQEVSIEPASEASMLFVNVAIQPTATVEPTATIEPTPTEVPLPPDRPVLIISGTCADPTTNVVVAELNDLRLPEGDVEGQMDAVTAETSSTTTDVSLEDMLATDHVVVAFADDDLEATGDPVACAPIGGIVNDDGELVIGLKELDDSEYTGIVYLAPMDEDPSRTHVSVFLAEELDEEDEEATPGA